MEPSPRPWILHRTGSLLGIKDANGKHVIRVVVNMFSTEKWEQLKANLDLIIQTVNAASGDYVDRAVQNEGLDCPVCGERRAFTIDDKNPANGYCVAEDVIHTIKVGPMVVASGGRLILRDGGGNQ